MLRELNLSKFGARKLLALAASVFAMNCFADSKAMAHDVLDEIIHGPVNTDPTISEDLADQSVVLSLRAAIVNLACIQRSESKESVVNQCIAKVKPKVPSIGTLSESSFALGLRAARDQVQIHHEVSVAGYTSVIEYLLNYSQNLLKVDSSTK